MILGSPLDLTFLSCCFRLHFDRTAFQLVVRVLVPTIIALEHTPYVPNHVSHGHFYFFVIVSACPSFIWESSSLEVTMQTLAMIDGSFERYNRLTRNPTEAWRFCILVRFG